MVWWLKLATASRPLRARLMAEPRRRASSAMPFSTALARPRVIPRGNQYLPKTAYRSTARGQQAPRSVRSPVNDRGRVVGLSPAGWATAGGVGVAVQSARQRSAINHQEQWRQVYAPAAAPAPGASPKAAMRSAAPTGDPVRFGGKMVMPPPSYVPRTDGLGALAAQAMMQRRKAAGLSTERPCNPRPSDDERVAAVRRARKLGKKPSGGPRRFNPWC